MVTLAQSTTKSHCAITSKKEHSKDNRITYTFRKDLVVKSENKTSKKFRDNRMEDC